MEFSWPILVSVAIANVLCMGAMLLAQSLDKNLPPRNSFVPGTKQGFLYIQDFWTMTWGDGIGVLLITNAFVHLAVEGVTDLWWALPVGLVGTTLFVLVCCSKNHKDDWGYYDGGFSFGGGLHLLYFGFGFGVSAMCAWNLITGDLRGPVMWVALAGGAFYVGCFILELRSGNFDALNPATLHLNDDEISPPSESPVWKVFNVVGWACAWMFYPGAMAAVTAYKKEQQKSR